MMPKRSGIRKMRRRRDEEEEEEEEEEEKSGRGQEVVQWLETP